MSADNGVYIGRFPKTANLHQVELHPVDYEYRVIHAQAIENINWFPDDKDSDENQSALDKKFNGENPREIVEFYNEAEVMDEATARQKAFDLEQKILSDEYCLVLEYGISTITFKQPFSYYKDHAHEIVYRWDK